MIRFIYMLVAFVYSIGVTGLHVNLHWCSGELASLNINATEQDGCCCDDRSDKSDDCCSDSGFYVKVDNTHAAASGVVIPVLNQIAFIPSPSLVLKTIDVSRIEFGSIFQTADLPPPDLLVKHCCYLI